MARDYIWQLLGQSNGGMRSGSAIGKPLHVDSVDCAFCQGSGVGRNSYQRCQVCGGSGRRKVRPPVVTCAFCRGKGQTPWGEMTCPVCSGVGVVSVREPVERCSQCGGSGKNPAGRLYCARCRGSGVVTAKPAKVGI